MLKLLAAVVIAACSVAWTFGQRPKPLSKESISKLLSAQVYPHRIEILVQEIHVDFQMTPDLEKQFRALGANDELLEVLRKSYQPSSVAPPAPPPASPAELAIQHYRQGEAYYGESKWDEAIREYQTAIKLKPDEAEAYGAWAFTLETKGDVEGAIAQYRKALKLKPGDADLHTNLGEALYKKNDLDGAIAEYGQALRLAPMDFLAHNNLGATLSAKGDVDGAVREYREAIRLAPDDAQAHNNLGVALAKQGDQQGATAEYQKAVKLDPNFAEAWYDVAMGLAASKDTERAIEALLNAVRIKPDWPKAHLSLGVMLERQKDESGAVAEALEAARLKPDYKLAHAQAGAALIRLGCWKEAIEEYRRVATLSPNDPKAHATLGGALYAAGDSKGSLEEYETAIKLDPKDKSFRESRKVVSHRLKKGDQASLASGKTEPQECTNLASFSALLPYVERQRAPASQSTGITPTRIRVGAQVEAAKLIYARRPVYPQLAKMAYIQGLVRLEALIGKDGTIRDIKAISGHPLLVKAAMDAVSRWRYQPTLLNGEPVEVATEIDVHFTLRQ